ncbi:hypothetical protein Pcinc_011541 [Petrolisthes cinctipes]|uniref:Uncharacterized protein n=1 Tax=Petrolisthes cinctipes TaxID=88211 RepID=A0AAE1G2H5_PETCI|nr:hypothetical protein Pcinc_011541 [Petrolisthes cinctipes]
MNEKEKERVSMNERMNEKEKERVSVNEKEKERVSVNERMNEKEKERLPSHHAIHQLSYLFHPTKPRTPPSLYQCHHHSTNPTVLLPLHPTVPPSQHQSLIPPRPVPPSRQSYRLSYFSMTKPFPRQLSTQLPSHLPQYPHNLVLLRYPASTLTHDATPRHLPTYLSSSPYLSPLFHTCLPPSASVSPLPHLSPPFHTCLPPSASVFPLPHLSPTFNACLPPSTSVSLLPHLSSPSTSVFPLPNLSPLPYPHYSKPFPTLLTRFSPSPLPPNP